MEQANQSINNNVQSPSTQKPEKRGEKKTLKFEIVENYSNKNEDIEIKEKIRNNKTNTNLPDQFESHEKGSPKILQPAVTLYEYAKNKHINNVNCTIKFPQNKEIFEVELDYSFLQSEIDQISHLCESHKRKIKGLRSSLNRNIINIECLQQSINLLNTFSYILNYGTPLVQQNFQNQSSCKQQQQISDKNKQAYLLNKLAELNYLFDYTNTILESDMSSETLTSLSPEQPNLLTNSTSIEESSEILSPVTE